VRVQGAPQAVITAALWVSVRLHAASDWIGLSGSAKAAPFQNHIKIECFGKLQSHGEGPEEALQAAITATPVGFRAASRRVPLDWTERRSFKLRPFKTTVAAGCRRH
jgi:hypothetical protein